MESDHYKRVKEFMLRGHQDCPMNLTWPDEPTRSLRARLILEEALETVQALGFVATVAAPKIQDSDAFPDTYGEPRIGLLPTYDHNPQSSQELVDCLADIADGCADVSVVALGTLIACGIPDEPVLECVDQNNLDKFGAGSRKREDGKILKPPGHQPPALDRVLAMLERMQGRQ